MAAEKEKEKEKEKPTSKGQAWFCTTGLPSDAVIEVHDMTFHLHKFPLMSKSRTLHRLITEQEKQQEDNQSGITIDEEAKAHITLPDFPGGSDTFEAAAKFCYGVKLDLSASIVAPLRCAAEYLEMTEYYSEDNLVSKTELFLSNSVFKSLKDSVKALKSCEKVLSLAETLGIVERCIDSVSSKASSSDPASLFGWPVTGEGGDSRNQALWNGIESAIRRKAAKSGVGGEGSWLEHVADLSLPLFKRLISAMRSRNLSPEVLESCLMYYAKRNIPGISRSNRTRPSASTSTTSTSSLASESEQREVLEAVITNLPLERRSSSSSSRSPAVTRFLFGLLRTAYILNAPQPIRAALERKLGSQLDQATLDDLLIPSYSYLNETLYDVDCVERILGHFLDTIEEGRRSRSGIEEEEEEEEEEEGERDTAARSPALMLVGKLIDGYLAEIASDANLKPDRFYNLAVSLPDQARLFDDGLYRAVDVYIKAHPWIAEGDRERICGVMDCQKLTLEACTHAAQNERLPLRAVVQVLFFEQLQLRHAIAGTLIAAEASVQAASEAGRVSVLRTELEEEEEDQEEGNGGSNGTWREAVRENQVLRLDMDSMRTRVHQLERECSSMKKVIEKIDKEGGNPTTRVGGGGGGGGWKGSLTRKFGCKFKTQVCDSHEPTVVNSTKGKQDNNPNHQRPPPPPRHHHHRHEE